MRTAKALHYTGCGPAGRKRTAAVPIAAVALLALCCSIAGASGGAPAVPFVDDIPRHAGAFQYDYAGDDGSGHSGEGFVPRLTDDLSALDASTFLGGSDNDWPECVVLDEDGNAYVTGSTISPDFPTMHGSYEENWQGGSSDAFVSVLSSDLGAIGVSADPQCGLSPLAVEFAGTAPGSGTRRPV